MATTSSFPMSDAGAAPAGGAAPDEVEEQDSLFGSIHLLGAASEWHTTRSAAAAAAAAAAASSTTATKLLLVDSFSSISFDASYASVFGDCGKSPVSSRNTSRRNKLCLSRWESSLGDPNRGGLLLGDDPPGIQRAVSSDTNMTTGTSMAVQMPLRQQSSHSRLMVYERLLHRRVSLSGGGGEPLKGESSSSSKAKGEHQHEQQQQQQQQPHRLLPPRPAMTKFKDDMSLRRLLTRAASEKSVLPGGRASNHTFAAYSLLGGRAGTLSNHGTTVGGTSSSSVASFCSKESTTVVVGPAQQASMQAFLSMTSTTPTLNNLASSNHTFASFTNGASNHTGILSTWESVEEKSFGDDDDYSDDSTTIVSFSSSTMTSLLTLARKL
jgi:hypothetical protein